MGYEVKESAVKYGTKAHAKTQRREDRVPAGYKQTEVGVIFKEPSVFSVISV